MNDKELGREIKALAIQNDQDMGPVFSELKNTSNLIKPYVMEVEICK